MISTIIQIIYLFLLLLFVVFILRVSYFLFLKLVGEIRGFLGVMIEGSEYYWRWRWKKLHKEKPMVYETIDKYHPTRGWTPIPNLKYRFHYAATINSNSKGERGLKEKYLGKKVMFYGDSFCFGEGVDDNETIPAFFEKHFKNVKAINLGVHGYGIDQQYLYLKDTIHLYKPILTCFIITDGDFRRNFMDFRDFAKPKFLVKNDEIILTNVPVPKPEDIKDIPFYILLFEFIKHFFIFYGLIGKKERLRICDHLLGKIQEHTRKINSDLIFIYINDVRRGFWYRSYIDRYFINYFKKNNIKYLYLEEIYGKKKLREMFDALSGHLSVEGNKKVAEELSNFVKSKDILK